MGFPVYWSWGFRKYFTDLFYRKETSFNGQLISNILGTSICCDWSFGFDRSEDKVDGRMEGINREKSKLIQTETKINSKISLKSELIWRF